MGVRLVDKTPFVLSETRRKASLGLRFILDGVDRESTPRTPRKTGDLRNRKLKQVLGLKSKIAWQTNYAVYQETKKFRKYSTPGTGPHYAEDAVKKVVRDSATYFRRAGIGR